MHRNVKKFNYVSKDIFSSYYLRENCNFLNWTIDDKCDMNNFVKKPKPWWFFLTNLDLWQILPRWFSLRWSQCSICKMWISFFCGLYRQTRITASTSYQTLSKTKWLFCTWKSEGKYTFMVLSGQLWVVLNGFCGLGRSWTVLTKRDNPRCSWTILDIPQPSSTFL